MEAMATALQKVMAAMVETGVYLVGTAEIAEMLELAEMEAMVGLEELLPGSVTAGMEEAVE